jgi:hypothetical protein
MTTHDGFGISSSTAWRYVREAADLLAGPVDDVRAAGGRAARPAYAILDGTLVPSPRLTGIGTRRYHPPGTGRIGGRRGVRASDRMSSGCPAVPAWWTADGRRRCPLVAPTPVLGVAGPMG